MNTDQGTVECIVELRVWTHDGPEFDHIVRELTPDAAARLESAIRHPAKTAITALVRWDG